MATDANVPALRVFDERVKTLVLGDYVEEAAGVGGGRAAKIVCQRKIEGIFAT